MTVHLWRLATDTPDWTAEDMDGKGAAAKGSRWNSPGEHLVCTSMSISLAVWESHLKATGCAE